MDILAECTNIELYKITSKCNLYKCKYYGKNILIKVYLNCKKLDTGKIILPYEISQYIQISKKKSLTNYIPEFYGYIEYSIDNNLAISKVYRDGFLESSSITQVHNLFEQDVQDNLIGDYVILLLEYIEGNILDNIQHEEVIKKTIRMMNLFHGNNIIHNNISSTHILLKNNINPILIDFSSTTYSRCQYIKKKEKNILYKLF